MTCKQKLMSRAFSILFTIQFAVSNSSLNEDSIKTRHSFYDQQAFLVGPTISTQKASQSGPMWSWPCVMVDAW